MKQSDSAATVLLAFSPLVKVVISILLSATAIYFAVPIEVAWWRVALGTVGLVIAGHTAVAEALSSNDTARRQYKQQMDPNGKWWE